MVAGTMPVKVKICGITNVPDAEMVAAAGADAVGFMFWDRSPRFIVLDAGAAMDRALPPHVLRVGVFVDAAPDLVVAAIARCRLDLLQFHGDEPPEYCRQFGLMCLKAFRVRDASALARLPAYQTEAWLLDAWSPALPGGTGETFNWDLAVEAGKLGRPIFLAGGLTPANVGDAICKVRPFGVDVSSGVESAPGKKDADKVRAFITNARAAGDQRED